MARVFVDTSAVIALLVPTDDSHHLAKRIFQELWQREVPLVATSYVLLETYALLGRRIGLPAISRFRRKLAPLIKPIWVDQSLHERGLDLLQLRSVRDLSLVDTVSFVAIREHGIDEVFAFDHHFDDEGFHPLS